MKKLKKNLNSKVSLIEGFTLWQNIKHIALASVAHLVGASSHRLKACEFGSQSGCMPGLWVQSLARAHARRQLINVSPSPSL